MFIEGVLSAYRPAKGAEEKHCEGVTPGILASTVYLVAVVTLALVLRVKSLFYSMLDDLFLHLKSSRSSVHALLK